jgi:hypothetical protein
MKTKHFVPSPVNEQMAAKAESQQQQKKFQKTAKAIFSSTLFLLAIVLLISGFVGCSKKDDAKQTVPLKAEFGTTSAILQQGPPEIDSINGQGYGTPFGKSSFIVHAQFDANYNLTGAIVVTTENGDKVFATILGKAPDIDANGDIVLHFASTITGGTGKFLSATGSFSGIAHETIYTAAGSASWDGTITY